MAKILVVNGHCLGEYCDVVKLPSAGATVTARNRRYNDDGGKGSNAAVAIGRLGGSVAFVGKSGDDEGGMLGMKWMREAGVDLSHYFLDRNVKTNVGLCVVAEDGSNMIFNFFDDRNAVTPEELDEYLPQCEGAEYLITGFELPWKTALHAARLGDRMGLIVVLNPSPIDETMDLGDLSFVDILIINENEAAVLLREPVDAITDYMAAAKKIRDTYGPARVVITLGGKGSIACTPEGELRAEPCPASCVDTVGAGDGYLAALVWRLSEGACFADAMQWASSYAAYICSHVGTIGVFPDHTQLRQFRAQAKKK